MFSFKTAMMMYAIILRPKDLRSAIMGLAVLVNTHGVDDSPNGRHVN